MDKFHLKNFLIFIFAIAALYMHDDINETWGEFIKHTNWRIL